MRHIIFDKNFKPITNIGKYNIHGKKKKDVYFELKLRWTPGNRTIYPPNKSADYKHKNKNKSSE